MLLILIFPLISSTLSIQTPSNSHRTFSYNGINYLSTGASLPYFTTYNGLYDQAALESSLSGTGSGYGSSSRGRVVGNSILDFEPVTTSIITGTRSGVRYRSQSSQPIVRSQSQTQLPTRPITTGPSVGTVRNGIDENESETEEFEIEDGRQPPSSSRRGSKLKNDNVEVSKFVSVFVSPPEPIQSRRAKVIKAPQKVHYNIMFIKAPSTLPESQEIELPPSPQTKTLVYVLLRKPESKDLLRIRESPLQAPQKPEVFFIRYKNDGGKTTDRNRSTTRNKNELDEVEDDLDNNADNNAESEAETENENLNNNVNLKTEEPKRNGEFVRLQQYKSLQGGPEQELERDVKRKNSNLSRRLIPNLGGGYSQSYDDHSQLQLQEDNQNIDNSDFTRSRERESFDQDKLLLSSRLEHFNNKNQRVVHSEYSFSPIMKPSYGIASPLN